MQRLRRLLTRNVPLVILALLLLPTIVPAVLQSLNGWMGQLKPQGDIAGFFAPSVRYWEDDLVTWGKTYNLDPNLLATVMQIESCGHPTIASHAGAQGLFQVMPFHFSATEDMLDPDTNAMRSANFLNECHNWAGDNVGMIMACYNGGPSVTRKDFGNWPAETQRYYLWGAGIYNDAYHQLADSPTLDQWMNAGGSTLCNMAAAELNIN
ncbi:transglycosylase SLT domain-containing protein [Phototrophicus methaneseepsis]|uniref:Transglycosylase SLT domain-containing protein n=1 Tax=Phototrophicus methaneseepsis TaxID=2710758 RepID=A0A7S8IEP4_9CHLR|nr:transglycosylase SLT domain-containing protein [Phototrophicus methaneseepsis]QPC82801.1 transglycosylase SLT domain-containing protein [Phototrophicus methaneseepsis]